MFFKGDGFDAVHYIVVGGPNCSPCLDYYFFCCGYYSGNGFGCCFMAYIVDIVLELCGGISAIYIYIWRWICWSREKT